MRCRWCKRPFTQVEARKMVTAHTQPDGSIAYNVLTENRHASGPLVWAAHYKEFKEHEKREKRGGNAVSGSSLGGVTPTAYDIDSGAGTQAITDRQRLKREIAQELGVDSENWRVAEVLRRRDHDDRPYVHTHERPLEDWKTEFHLQQAHGVGGDGLVSTVWDAPAVHRAEHLQQARAQDPGYNPYDDTTDWHDSIDIDV